MKQHTSALLAGLLFGLGLVVSGMINPAKVQNFLDITGSWDPSLAFVMGGALLVTTPGFWWLRSRHQPVFADRFQWPDRQDIDPKLIGGSALFGAGWGLAGFCPGPAISALALARSEVIVFILAMVGGMAGYRLLLEPLMTTSSRA